jgi:hypothetical protein
MELQVNQKQRKVVLLLFFFVVAIFLFAAISKIVSFKNFISAIDLSLLTGNGFATLIAIFVILIEFSSIGLLFPKTRNSALVVLTGLCGSFLGYSGWKWAAQIPIPCNCFGPVLTMQPWMSLLLNLVLLVVLTWLRLVAVPHRRKELR